MQLADRAPGTRGLQGTSGFLPKKAAPGPLAAGSLVEVVVEKVRPGGAAVVTAVQETVAGAVAREWEGLTIGGWVAGLGGWIVVQPYPPRKLAHMQPVERARSCIAVQRAGPTSHAAYVAPAAPPPAGSLMPGALVTARVRNVLSDGLLVSFLTFFSGTIDPFHLGAEPGSDWKKLYR